MAVTSVPKICLSVRKAQKQDTEESQHPESNNIPHGQIPVSNNLIGKGWRSEYLCREYVERKDNL